MLKYNILSVNFKIQYFNEKCTSHVLKSLHIHPLRTYLSRSVPRSLENLSCKVRSPKKCNRTCITIRKMCSNESRGHTMQCRKDDLHTIAVRCSASITSRHVASWVPPRFSPNLHHKFELRNIYPTTNSSPLPTKKLVACYTEVWNYCRARGQNSIGTSSTLRVP
jgi:hypothetical protein